MNLDLTPLLCDPVALRCLCDPVAPFICRETMMHALIEQLKVLKLQGMALAATDMLAAKNAPDFAIGL